MKRAVSSLYYALFHELARICADSLIGQRTAHHSRPAWRQTYRALMHSHAKTQCFSYRSTILKSFPKQIEDFGNTFVKMQDVRHLCDYDPYHLVSDIDLQLFFALVEDSIRDIRDADDKDKRAFCAFVLFKQR